MSASIRPFVWLAVIVASVAVGWYIKETPNPDPTSAAPSTPGSYLFLAGGSDPYWDLCVAGARAAADEVNAKLDVRIPTSEGEEGMREQLEWLSTLEQSKYDGIAIGPIDPARQTTLINAAAEKAPIVTVDSDAPSSRRMFYIGSSNYEAGTMAGKMLKSALPTGGKVAVLMASEAKTNAAQRKQGLEEELARSNDDTTTDDDTAASAETSDYTVVEFYMDRGDFDACRDNVRKACEEHDDLAAIVGTFGYHGPIALEVLTELSDDRDIAVIAFDEDERTLAGVDDERIYSTIVQDPFMFGAEAVQMLEKVRQHKFLTLPVANGGVGVHCKAITKENINDFRTELEKRLKATLSVPAP